MDAIGRDEGVQFALDARQGLVTFVGAGGGIGIKEGREVVRLDTPVNDIVFLRTLEFN